MKMTRYLRQTILPEVGTAGQERLAAARVLVVGAGGLGSPALLYLAAAGVGTLGIVDSDSIELTNLQRQILYTVADLDQLKTTAAQARLQAFNPDINIVPHALWLTAVTVLDIISHYDYVVDGSDNFATRYLVNDSCVQLAKPLISASILRWQGHCAVFALPQGPCYRCLFPEPPALALNCAQAGVMGALAGILGSFQALEVIKLILHQSETLRGKLLTVDALTLKFRQLLIQKNPSCMCSDLPTITTLSTTEKIKMTTCSLTPKPCPEISIVQFKTLQAGGLEFQLLDIRQPEEYSAGNLQGISIPLDQLTERLGELDPAQLTIVHCEHGVRSQRAAIILQAHGFKKVKSLAGGYAAWLADSQ